MSSSSGCSAPTWPIRVSPTSRRASGAACRWGCHGSSRIRSRRLSCSCPVTRPATSPAPSCRSIRAAPTSRGDAAMTDLAAEPDDPLATDLQAYRDEVRQFVTSPALDKWRGVYIDDVAEEMRFTAGLMRALYDAGFGRYGLPAEVGGLGGDVRHWAVLYDELAQADLPLTGQHSLLTTLAYPVVRFAPHLAAAYLPEFL